MASNANVFFGPGFIEDGFFQPLVVAPVPPATITLGSPGAAVYAMPFRALGGSVLDLDVLYGLLGHAAAKEDIQPIFALGTRRGLIRVFGYEIPRQGILDVVIEAYATLIDVEDIVIEGNPAGDNLLGYVGLTTRPISSVRISNADGYCSQLAVRELVLNAPAGLFADIGHTVVMPVLTGTVTGYEQDGPDMVISYGFSARRKRAPLIVD